MINLIVIGLDLSNKSFGGVRKYTRLLLKNIDKKYFNVNYYSLGKSPNWSFDTYRPSQSEFLLRLLKKILLLPIYLKKKNANIVHLNSSLTRLSLIREGIMSYLAKLIGCKTLFFIHGWKEYEFSRIKNNFFLKKLFINLLKNQDKIMVLSNNNKKKLIEIGLSNKKIGVSTTMVNSIKYNKYIKRKFETPYTVLICANIIKNKGIFELFEAVSLVLKEFPNTKFIFMGDGDDIEILNQKIENKELQNKIILTGYQKGEKKINIFLSSHIFALPSYTEGFPTVVLEAMASGLPLVVTPVGGIIDAIKNRYNGLLLNTVPPKPEEIAEKIITLMKNPDLMKKMSRNNVSEVKNKYDVKIVSNEVCEVYKEILNITQ